MEEATLDKFIEEKGYIYAHVIFEIAGKPKQHVQKSMDAVIKNIDKDNYIIFVNKEFGEPQENEDGIWSGFIDTEILFRDIQKISYLITNFLPSTINILEPETIKLEQDIATEFFTDLMGHLHSVNTERVQITGVNKQLQKNAHAILRNAVLVSLKDKALTAKEIGNPLGFTEKDILPTLEVMQKRGKIRQEEDKFVLA